MSAPAKQYRIEAGAVVWKRCAACGVPMYEAPGRRPGSRVPIDCRPPWGREPSAEAPGYGESHFLHCTDPNRFNRSRRAR